MTISIAQMTDLNAQFTKSSKIMHLATIIGISLENCYRSGFHRTRTDNGPKKKYVFYFIDTMLVSLR
jgi:hypothetical protein